MSRLIHIASMFLPCRHFSPAGQVGSEEFGRSLGVSRIFRLPELRWDRIGITVRSQEKVYMPVA